MAEVVVITRDARLGQRILDRLPDGAVGRVTIDPDLHGARPDAWVVDSEFDGADGLALAREALAAPGEPSVILVAPLGRMDLAIEALRVGVTDLVTRPIEPRVLTMTLQRALERRALHREVVRLRGGPTATRAAAAIVGQSAPMRSLIRVLERVARAPSPVLITGESGTGKELVARAIHELSPRSAARFVAINCAAVPDALLESELFGHVRGAFTDAKSARAGLFAEAEHGTLLLDEIGDLPAALQPKLLRVLQERVYRPVGADREVPFDVRVLAATHRDLEALAEAGRFRQDLLFRVDVVRVDVPPLRDRGVDVLPLAELFLARSAAAMDRNPPRLGPDVARALVDYDWPGNVRELQNCMERVAALAEGDEVELEDLPPRVRAARRHVHQPESHDVDSMPTLEEVERAHVARVLHATAGNRAQAARILGIDRKTLWRKLQGWDMAGPDPTP